MHNKLSKLEGYLRVADVPARAWASILSHITSSAGFSVTPDGEQSSGGDIACLTLPEGRICYLKSPAALRVEGSRSGTLSLLMLLEGKGELEVGGHDVEHNNRIVLLPPGEDMNLTTTPGSEVVLVQIISRVRDTVSITLSEDTAATLSDIVESYLARAVFFQDHDHAVELSRQLIELLKEKLEGSADAAPDGLRPELGERVRRALALIETDEWQYNLHELASAAGASERNLYYMMKRQIGMTPYLVFQRHRLLQVRRDIVSEASGRAQIGPLANRAGFMHLGRFAALYRKHFGELPSETVAECARLREIAEDGARSGAAQARA